MAYIGGKSRISTFLILGGLLPIAFGLNEPIKGGIRASGLIKYRGLVNMTSLARSYLIIQIFTRS